MRNSLKIAVAAIAFGVAASLFAVYGRVKSSALGMPSAAKFARAFPDDSRQVLESCDRLTLYSLDPGPAFRSDGMPFQGGFHDFPILGRVDIPANKRVELLAQLYNGLDVPNNFTLAACFNPRHGVRAEKGNRYADLVICFSCSQMQVYTDKRKGEQTTGIMSEPVADFNRRLTEAGAKLPSN